MSPADHSDPEHPHPLPPVDPKVTEAATALLNALVGLRDIIAKAGVANLAKGIEGDAGIPWAVKASAKMEAANAVIARATGGEAGQ